MSYIPVDGPRQGITNRFRIDGRRNRWSFFMGCVGVTILGVLSWLILVLAWGLVEAALPNHTWGVSVFFEIALGLVWLYLGAWFLSFVGQRLHDLDKSGALIPVMLIPVVNVLFLLVLIFKVGTKGDNQYGPDPRTYYEVIDGVSVPVAGPGVHEN